MISSELFKAELFDLLTETFEQVQGKYLDRGTSLFETLATISAATASQPVSANCASLAAQVEHVRFYLEHIEQYILGNEPGKADWGHIWRTVEAVTPAEWDASRERLRVSYQHLRTTLDNLQTWDGEDEIGGAMVIIVHTAYHLGEIRQALCTLNTQN